MAGQLTQDNLGWSRYRPPMQITRSTRTALLTVVALALVAARGLQPLEVIGNS